LEQKQIRAADLTLAESMAWIFAAQMYG